MKDAHRVITGILFKIICFYLLLVVFLYFYQRNLLYFPDTTRPDVVAHSGGGVEVAHAQTKDGLELEGWYFAGREDKPVLLYFHGNASNIASRVPKIAEIRAAGYGVLLAEYRGYGGNPGKPSEQGFYADAHAYMDWLESRSIMPDRVVLYGESIGSGVATQMATEYAVGGLILEAPFTAATEIAKKIYFYVPVGLLMRDRFSNIDKIGQVKAPILILHGDMDTVIPPAFGRQLYEASPEPRLFVSLAGAGHNDAYDYGAALHVLEFLSNITVSAAAQSGSVPDKKD